MAIINEVIEDIIQLQEEARKRKYSEWVTRQDLKKVLEKLYQTAYDDGYDDGVDEANPENEDRFDYFN